MNTLVFIDSHLNDYQTLVTGTVPGTEVFILSSDQDGIVQISTVLQQHPESTTVHIVSHGSPGSLFLGNSQLNLTNIYQYQAILGTWNVNQILLYGCNVASGDAGSEFISKLHQITGANITATATLTGNAVLGGNWDLEVSFPEKTDKSLIFNKETLANYQGVFAPTLVGVWDRLSWANDVTIVGNYAYAVGDILEIIDITDPNNFIFKGNYDLLNGQDVQVVGNYAYVVDSNQGLKIIDISNPLNPTLKGTYDTSGYAEDVQVVGNYAYVSGGSSGVQIIDISNPATPIFISNYSGSGGFDQVVGNLAYVAAGSSGLQIIDISNPTTPILKGTYDTNSGANNVQVVGNLAYVADDNLGLQIIDISDPTTPILISDYDIRSGASLYVPIIGNSATDIEVAGNYAYIISKDSPFFYVQASELQVIDISDPTNPILNANYYLQNFAWDIEIAGNLAYVAEDYSGIQTSGLEILDISNSPQVIFKNNYNTSGFAYDAQIVGNYAYVADAWSGLQIIDISNPATPILKSNYNTFRYAVDVQIVNNYAYIAGEIIDISNPLNPTRKGSYYTSNAAWDAQIVGNYAYVADGSSGLQIIDITNPTTPIFKGNYDTSGTAYDVQIVGNLAYVADGDSGLQIIDITNPTAPILKGTYNTSGNAQDVQVVGNLAYVADGSRLQIIDITNTLNPTLQGSYDSSGYAQNVQIVGNLAYVAGGSGLQIIDITNPLNPTLQGSYNTLGNAQNVQIVGNFAYIADYEGGLKIIDVSEFTNANNQFITGNPTANLSFGTEDTPYIINTSSLLQGFFFDDDGNTLSVQNLTADYGTLVNNNNGTYTLNPDSNYYGLVNLTYDVTDGNGSTLTGQNRSVYLTSVNDAPIVTNSIPNQQAQQNVFWNYTLPYNIFTDIEGDTLIYNATNLPSWLTFNSITETFSGTPTNNTPTNYTINLIADDGHGGITSTPFLINVLPNSGTLSFSNSTYAVNEDGTAINQVTINRTGGSYGNVTVMVIPTDGSATATNDYNNNPITVTFANGETSKTVNIPIVNDTLYEGNETFNLILANPTGGAILGNQTTANVTIVDNDPVKISLSANNVTEGNSGTTPLTFTLSLSNASTLPVSVNYATFNGTAYAGYDYNPINGTVTFNAGETTKTLTVDVIGDLFNEGNETFGLQLTNPTNATIPTTQAIATIIDDDPLPSLSINNISLAEGNNGTTLANFSVKLSNASGTAVTVNYATADGTATIADNDYTASSGTLTFAPGNTLMTVSVPIFGDTIVEASESFYLNLSNVNGATLANTQGIGLILDDDANANLTLTGTNSNDILNGGAGNDTISGLNGNDTIDGKAGDDILLGGLGADILTGGLGADKFSYNSFNDSLLGTSTQDRIRDFNPGQGDRIAFNSLPTNVFNAGVISAGNLNAAILAAYNDANPTLAGSQILGINEAVFFSYGATVATRRTYLSVNDSTTGFSAGSDLFMEVTGMVGTLGNGQLTVNDYFAVN